MEGIGVGVIIGVMLMIGLFLWSVGQGMTIGQSEHWPEEKKDKANENDGW